MTMTEKTKDMPSKGFTETLANGCEFEMVYIEGGTFFMGSQDNEGFSNGKPVHEVILDNFYLGKYPVTQALWIAVMGVSDNPSYFKGNERPVESVFWEDAQIFINSLNGLTGKSYRLPTEAEWEYAARGGSKSKGYRYAGSNKLKEVAWYEDNSHGETEVVGLKYPNELGVYDMSGNVLEWCQDWYSESYYEECWKKGAVKDPQGPDKGVERVLRGGSWNNSPRDCQCVFRSLNYPHDRYRDIGFRLCLSK